MVMVKHAAVVFFLFFFSLLIRNSKASQRAVCPSLPLGKGFEEKNNISSSVLSAHFYTELHPNDIFIPGDMALNDFMC